MAKGYDFRRYNSGILRGGHGGYNWVKSKVKGLLLGVEIWAGDGYRLHSPGTSSRILLLVGSE